VEFNWLKKGGSINPLLIFEAVGSVGEISTKGSTSGAKGGEGSSKAWLATPRPVGKELFRCIDTIVLIIY